MINFKKTPSQNFIGIRELHLSSGEYTDISVQYYKHILRDILTNFYNLTGQLIDTNRIIKNSLIDFNEIFNEDFVENHIYGLPAIVVPYPKEYIIESSDFLDKKNMFVIKGTNNSKLKRDSEIVTIPLIEIKNIQKDVKIDIILNIKIKQHSEVKYYAVKMEIENAEDAWDTVTDTAGDIVSPIITNVRIFPQQVDETSLVYAFDSITSDVDDNILDNYDEVYSEQSINIVDYENIITQSLNFHLIEKDGRLRDDNFPSYVLSLFRNKVFDNNMEIDINVIYAHEKNNELSQFHKNKTLITFFGREELTAPIDMIKRFENKEIELGYIHGYYPIISSEIYEDVIEELNQEYSTFSISDTSASKLYQLASKLAINDQNMQATFENSGNMSRSYKEVANRILGDMLNANDIDAKNFRKWYFNNGRINIETINVLPKKQTTLQSRNRPKYLYRGSRSRRRW